MKAAYFTAIAALAASVVAAPTGGKVTQTLESVTSALDLTAASPSATTAATKAADTEGATGKIVQDLGPKVNNVLTITGPNAKQLLIELSPEVAGLLSSLGLPALGTPVGSVVASASSLGDLVAGLGPDVEGLLTVVGEGGEFLLVSLAPDVAGLLSGLGLPGVGTPVGSLLTSVAKNLKRGMVVGDITPTVQQTVEVTGTNAESLLVELSPEVSGLVAGLGLTSISGPIGEVVDKASTVGELVNHTGAPTHELLSVIGTDGKALLVRLSSPVAKLLAGLGLAGPGAAVGSVVNTVGKNL
ncbi:hypothetical protein BDV18DRAFT_109494 [Aspergillus unguis]